MCISNYFKSVQTKQTNNWNQPLPLTAERNKESLCWKGLSSSRALSVSVTSGILFICKSSITRFLQRQTVQSQQESACVWRRQLKVQSYKVCQTADLLTSRLSYSQGLRNTRVYCRKKRPAVPSFHPPALSVWDLILHMDTQYYSQPSCLVCTTKRTIPYWKGLTVFCVLLSIKQYLLFQIPDCWQSLLRNLNKVTWFFSSSE